MDATEPIVTGAAEGRGRPPRKGRGKPIDAAKGKRSLNLSIPVEDYERFALHALRMTGGNISELVCQLGRQHLREYHISRTGSRAGEGGAIP
jgi:hypothetical protein